MDPEEVKIGAPITSTTTYQILTHFLWNFILWESHLMVIFLETTQISFYEISLKATKLVPLKTDIYPRLPNLDHHTQIPHHPIYLILWKSFHKHFNSLPMKFHWDISYLSKVTNLFPQKIYIEPLCNILIKNFTSLLRVPYSLKVEFIYNSSLRFKWHLVVVTTQGHTSSTHTFSLTHSLTHSLSSLSQKRT